jgi:outer membrane protein TolC
MSTLRSVPFALLFALCTCTLAQEPANPKKADEARGKDTKDQKAPVQPPPPPGTILQPGEHPIDLATALSLAGVQNPELLLARERVTEAAALRMLAAAQALPNLNVGTNYDMHRGVLQQSSGNILNVRRDALYLGLGASAVGAGTVNIPGLQYNLNVGAAWFDYLRTRQNLARASAATRTASNDVLLRVCLAYSELLRGSARLAVAVQNRREAAEIARITAVYARAGEGRQADADRAEVELRKRDADQTQAEADILIASARLAQLLNLDPSVRLRPLDPYVVPIPIVPDPLPLPELLAIALVERPEMAERRAEILETIYALSSAKLLPFSPNVILGFSSGDFGGGSNLISTPPGFVGSNGQLQTGPRFGDFGGRVDFDAVMYWTAQNLGVGNCAQIRIAASRNRQADLRRVETLNRIRVEVAEALARVASRFLQIDTTARAIQASQEAYEADLKRIKQREGLPIELLDSLRLLGRSRYEHLDAIVDYNEAQFRLYVAIGQPAADVLVRPVRGGSCPLPPPSFPARPASTPPAEELAPAPRPLFPARPEPGEGGKQ